MSSSHRRFSPEQTAQIVRRHLADNESVSALNGTVLCSATTYGERRAMHLARA